MTELYNQIELAQKFTGDANPQPTVDRSSQTSIGMEMAARMSQPQPQPEVRPMAPIVPVAN